MWGQPIEVAFQKRDLPFYTASTPTPAPLIRASPSTKAQPSAYPATQAVATATSLFPVRVLTSEPSSSTAAIGLSLTVVGTFLIALVLYLLWRRRQRTGFVKQRIAETLVEFRTHAESKRQDIC